MSELDTLSATYKLVTPMFMAGAEQQRAELRLPSIKGALRFWWRALAWDGFKGELPNLKENLDEIKKLEKKLFGSSDEKFGQSSFLMTLQMGKYSFLSPPKQLKDEGQIVGPGARYLGYGVMEAFASGKKGTKEAELTRPCYDSAEFTIKILFRKTHGAKERKSILTTFKALGLFGSLGSKARKGYGSLALLKLEKDDDVIWEAPQTFTQYETQLKTLISVSESDRSYSALPTYTAFSKHSRIITLQGENSDTPLSLLNKIGLDQVFFRSWGRNERVLNQKSETNFKGDHDLMKGVSVSIEHPERVAFGLPHNYGNRDRDKVTPIKSDRRASPLFIHIHDVANEPVVATLMLLPAVFLNEQICVLGEKVTLNKEGFWRPLDDFLDRLLGNPNKDPNLKKRRSTFTQVKELRNA